MYDGRDLPPFARKIDGIDCARGPTAFPSEWSRSGRRLLQRLCFGVSQSRGFRLCYRGPSARGRAFHEDETGVRVGIEDEDVYRFLFQTLDNETLRDAVVPWLLRFCYLTPTDRQIAAASNELGRRRQDPAFARMARPNAGAERRLIQIYEAALARANPNLQRLMHPFEMLNFGFYAAYLVLELLYARSDSGGNAEPMRGRLLDGAINRNTAEVFQIELQHLHNEIQDGGIERLLDYRDVNMNVLPQWRPENIAHRIKHYLSPARFQEFQALVNFHEQFQNDVGHKTIQAMAILSERLPPD